MSHRHHHSGGHGGGHGGGVFAPVTLCLAAVFAVVWIATYAIQLAVLLAVIAAALLLLVLRTGWYAYAVATQWPTFKRAFAAHQRASNGPLARWCQEKPAVRR